MPYNKLREYNGKGIFEFKMEKPIKQEANFKIYFFSNAQIKVETSFFLTMATAKIMEEYLKGLVDVSLNGIVIDERGDTGTTISIEEMVIKSLIFNFKKGESIPIQLELQCFSTVEIRYSEEISGKVEGHYGLTNFIFSGCIYSVEGNRFSLDRFNANVNNLNFLFKKVGDYTELEKRLKDKKGCHVTSEAIIDIPINEENTARDTIFDIIELLSLATRNFISPIYEDYFQDGKLFRTILNPILTNDYNSGDDLINSREPNPCVFQIFLESTYNKYKEFKDILGLKSVVHLYLISRYSFFIESKFLLAVVSLESLLSYFDECLKTKGKPIKPSSIGRTKNALAKVLKREGMNIEDPILDRIASSVAYPYPTFLDKLIPLLKKFKVKYTSDDIDLINLRNEIVHFGKFPEEFNSRQINPEEEETRLVYFLDRILLSILDYKNKPFLNIFNKYQEEELS